LDAVVDDVDDAREEDDDDDDEEEEEEEEEELVRVRTCWLVEDILGTEFIKDLVLFLSFFFLSKSS